MRAKIVGQPKFHDDIIYVVVERDGNITQYGMTLHRFVKHCAIPPRQLASSDKVKP